MSHWIKRAIFRTFGAVLCLAALTSCDVSTPTHSGDNSVIPSNLRMVSYNELPGWRDDDVRYALQAFRNSCRAKIQFTGRVIPDRALFAEKCRMLPSASADVATIRAWFESNFQPYQIFDDNGGDTGLYTGYYSPIIPGCRTKTAQCNEPLMGVPTDGRNYKGVPKKQIVEQQIGRPLYWANIVDVQNIQIQGSGMLQLDDGTMVKLNFAAVNDLPFKSIGEQLRARGIRPPNGYSADAVWQYLKQNPTLAREVIYKQIGNTAVKNPFHCNGRRHLYIGIAGIRCDVTVRRAPVPSPDDCPGHRKCHSRLDSCRHLFRQG